MEAWAVGTSRNLTLSEYQQFADMQVALCKVQFVCCHIHNTCKMCQLSRLYKMFKITILIVDQSEK